MGISVIEGRGQRIRKIQLEAKECTSGRLRIYSEIPTPSGPSS